MKLVLISIPALFVALAGMTWWALESSGVAVIETQTPEGTTRSTHVWYAEANGELWLEAGAPENPWFRDVQQNAVLTFTADGRSARYFASADDDASGHDRIRSMLREKYGFRDRWVSLLVDPSRSLAVRLSLEEE